MVIATKQVQQSSTSLLQTKLYKLAFAKQWLKEQNYQVFKGDQEILQFRDRSQLYNIDFLDTKIPIGEKLVGESRIKRISDYEDLLRDGYNVISRRVRKPWFPNQRVIYQILPKHLGGHKINRIPIDHTLWLDVVNRRYKLKGINAGPNGEGRWTRPKGGLIADSEEFNGRKKRIGLNYYKENYEKILARARGIEVIDTEYQKVPEIPLIIAESQELICLPESADEFVLGIVGERGNGKTVVLISVASRVYWKAKKNIVFINDRYRQTRKLSLPVQDPLFCDPLKDINEHPLPLPMVWLFPKTNTMFEKRVYGREVGLGHLISFPFKQAIQDYNNFFKGKKEWDMGMSAPLLRLIENKLADCTTWEDIFKVVNNAQLNDKDTSAYPIPKNSKGKVMRVLHDVYNQQMLDTSNGIPSKWKIIDKNTRETREYSPIVALMACRLVPSLMTENLYSKHYYAQYMKYILDDIFYTQMNDEYFETNKIVTYLAVDEITNIASTENKSVAQESLVTCVSEGRPNRIGFIYTTQNYSKIDRRIRTNTTHLLSFKLKDKESKQIGDDFDLKAHDENELKMLRKFEAVAMTSDKFIIYDQEGNRRESEPGEVFKGRVVPPLCEPSPPR